MRFGIRPLDEGVIIRQEKAPEKSTGGILLPQDAAKKPARGTVLAVGPGKLLANGTRSAMTVLPGDIVIFAPYAPETINLDGESLILVKESDIFGIVE